MVRRRTSWILVTVQTGRSPRLWVPVPIGFFDEFLRGVKILLWCFPRFSRLPRSINARIAAKGLEGISLKELASSAVDMLGALRESGPFTLVEMIDGETAVTVRLV